MKRKTKAAEEKQGTMPLSGHLTELRNRMAVCLILLVVVFLAGIYWAPQIVKFLLDIGYRFGYAFVYISPQELLLQYFSISMVVGIVVCMPMILFQTWAFVKPGLKEREKLLFLFAMIFGLICFCIGVFFAYRIMLPFMLRFLLSLSDGSGVKAAISVQNYLTFLLTIFLIFGAVFELPVVSVLLTQLGFVKIEWMKKGRRVTIVLIFFLAAVITPPDVVSQIMVAIPMLLLYELSIVFSTLCLRFRKQESEDPDTTQT